MAHHAARFLFGATLAAALVALPVSAGAQDSDPWDEGPPPPAGEAQGPVSDEPPIPPYAEGAPHQAQTGNYCFGGPHPVDTRAFGGPAFDDTEGLHLHPYPPLDLRLFTYREGCYYFIGDPRDFGYGGRVYNYYGAHPVHDHYGGGWCFMMGGHYHGWGPWSASFGLVGPWYYWYGPYDAHFWAYWPYYSHYYRSYYPHYYGGGRWMRRRDRQVAPPIARVPTPPTTWRGTPPPQPGGSALHGTPPAPAFPSSGGALRGAPPTRSGPSADPPGGGWGRGRPPTASPPSGGWGSGGQAPIRGTPPSASSPGRGTAPSSSGGAVPPRRR